MNVRALLRDPEVIVALVTLAVEGASIVIQHRLLRKLQAAQAESNHLAARFNSIMIQEDWADGQ